MSSEVFSQAQLSMLQAIIGAAVSAALIKPPGDSGNPGIGVETGGECVGGSVGSATGSARSVTGNDSDGSFVDAHDEFGEGAKVQGKRDSGVAIARGASESGDGVCGIGVCVERGSVRDSVPAPVGPRGGARSGEARRAECGPVRDSVLAPVGPRSGSVGAAVLDGGSVTMPVRERSQSSQEDGSFFREHVRTSRVNDYKNFLKTKFGIEVSRKGAADFALVTYTAGTVPDAFVDGRKKLQGLAAVGDAALTLLLVEDMVGRGESVASVQAVRSGALSNASMSAVFVNSGLGRHVAAAPGVDLKTAKTGADALEALAGVLWKYGDGPDGGYVVVRKLMKGLGYIH